MIMRIRRQVTVTVLDDTFRKTRVPLTLRACPRCPRGTHVFKAPGTGYGDHLGHIALGRLHGPVAMVSGGCPGDVSPSTGHGILRKAPYRTVAFMRALRALARTALD